MWYWYSPADLILDAFLSFSYKIANHTTLQVFINMVVL